MPRPDTSPKPAPQGGAQPAPQGGAQPAPQGGAQPAPQGGAQPAPQRGAEPARGAKPERADARRNRERLIAAARERFARDGTDVSLADIAREAGVGVGTVYRHFPTHAALVEAVYRDEVDRLSARGAELLREREPDEALMGWVEAFADFAVAKRGLRDALKAVVASGSDVTAHARAEIIASLGALLDAGVAAGRVRDDVGPEEALAALGAVWNVPDGDPEQARRVLRIVVDGLLRH
jgi:AcrR family transcriptional regulator